ncbi:hypothetical protein AYI69_g11456 [Smittium culicis]|uniref:Uncharacterized protein n=1 Tax=Smittium culicis TaxID=133412 RepID=A0A1R1WYH4_9FUNG|nr:hypothetical protein AYI69_g11456 [Smittium culicis]
MTSVSELDVFGSRPRSNVPLKKLSSISNAKLKKRISKDDVQETPLIKKSRSNNSIEGLSNEDTPTSTPMSRFSTKTMTASRFNSPRRFALAPKFQILKSVSKPSIVSKPTDINTFSFSPTNEKSTVNDHDDKNSDISFEDHSDIIQLQEAWKSQFLQPVLTQLDQMRSFNDRINSELEEKSKESLELAAKIDSQLRNTEKLNSKFKKLENDLNESSKECENQSKLIEKLQHEKSISLSKQISAEKQAKTVWANRMKDWSDAKSKIPNFNTSILNKSFNDKPNSLSHQASSTTNEIKLKNCGLLSENHWNSVLCDFQGLINKFNSVSKSLFTKSDQLIKMTKTCKSLEQQNSQISDELLSVLKTNKFLTEQLESENLKRSQPHENIKNNSSKLSDYDSSSFEQRSNNYLSHFASSSSNSTISSTTLSSELGKSSSENTNNNNNKYSREKTEDKKSLTRFKLSSVQKQSPKKSPIGKNRLKTLLSTPQTSSPKSNSLYKTKIILLENELAKYKSRYSSLLQKYQSIDNPDFRFSLPENSLNQNNENPLQTSKKNYKAQNFEQKIINPPKKAASRYEPSIKSNSAPSNSVLKQPSPETSTAQKSYKKHNHVQNTNSNRKSLESQPESPIVETITINPSFRRYKQDYFKMIEQQDTLRDNTYDNDDF